MARGISTAITARRAAVLALATAAATGLSACGAGQVTQTDTKQSAIAGVNVDAGDLALRDLQVEYASPEGYRAGDDAPLRVWIGNESLEAVSLVAVVTDAAEAVVLVSDDQMEDEATENEGGEPASAGSAAFELEIDPGDYLRLDQITGDHLVLQGLADDLRSGEAVAVTFQFSNGEEVQVNLPVGQAPEPSDERSSIEHPGAGH